MTEYRKPRLSELRPGDILIITNRDNDVSSEFLVDEHKLFGFLPIKFKALSELKLYSYELYPMNFLNRKNIYWKLKP